MIFAVKRLQKAKTMSKLSNLPLVGALCASALLLLLSCQKDSIVLPNFTRADQEKMGQLIEAELFADQVFQILPQTSPNDSMIYWYVQNLYNQATQTMRLDLSSPKSNRWQENRLWEVKIIDDDLEKIAFVLPGGNLYLSTGLLKSLEREYELYYFLTFESTLMHEDFLLNRLIREYNSITIQNVVDGTAAANAITIDIITEELPSLIFEPTFVEEIDQLTVRNICQTSIYNNNGLVPFLLEPTNANAAWLSSRQTYSNRASHIQGIEVQGSISCGDKTGSGNYQNYVLSMLED